VENLCLSAGEFQTDNVNAFSYQNSREPQIMHRNVKYYKQTNKSIFVCKHSILNSITVLQREEKRVATFENISGLPLSCCQSNQIYLKEKNNLYFLSEIIQNPHFDEIFSLVHHVDRK
jgi:hypothetical protein